jgi:hypothetical protein
MPNRGKPNAPKSAVLVELGSYGDATTKVASRTSLRRKEQNLVRRVYGIDTWSTRKPIILSRIIQFIVL